MGTSLRTTFSAESGTTRWVTTAVAGAALMALAATLPALADEPVPAEQDAVVQVVEQEPEAILGEPLEDEVLDGALDQSGSDFEGVIGEPLEDEVLDGALDQSGSDFEGVIGEPLEDEASADE